MDSTTPKIDNGQFDEEERVAENENPPQDNVIRVPNPSFPEGSTKASYANNIQDLTNEVETFLDFRYIGPGSYQMADDGRPTNFQLTHDLVARIVVPRSVFAGFVINFVRLNPDILRAVNETPSGNVDG